MVNLVAVNFLKFIRSIEIQLDKQMLKMKNIEI